jgi:RNA polymerase primary sigma factor
MSAERTDPERATETLPLPVPRRAATSAAPAHRSQELPARRALLGRDEELAVARRAREGDREALVLLIEANLRFASHIALEYAHLGIPTEDLQSEGRIGLIEAAMRFDPERGSRFITYAVWWIRKAILLALSEKSRMIRIPEYHLRKLAEAADSQTGEPAQPTVRTVSLDSCRDEDARPLVDCLFSQDEASPEADLLRHELARSIGKTIARLSEVEKAILAHRFGFDDAPLLPYKEIGKLLGVSHERVRQLERALLERLRTRLSALRSDTGRRSGRESEQPGQVSRTTPARTARHRRASSAPPPVGASRESWRIA